MKMPHLYADLPRLPEGAAILPGQFFASETGRLELEVGFAGGGFLLERVECCPLVRLVGLEWRSKQVSLVQDRLRRSEHQMRVRVFREDVRDALPRLAADSFDAVYLHFPDPWWKARHHKRRLSTIGMLQELSRVLRLGGELFIQSDVEAQIDEYERLMAGVPSLHPRGELGARLSDNPYGARSPRERRAIADGLPVYRLRYGKEEHATARMPLLLPA